MNKEINSFKKKFKKEIPEIPFPRHRYPGHPG